MYNIGKSGVDTADAMIHLHKLWPHKCNKWTRRFFFTVFSFLLDNCWIFWKLKVKISKRQFLEKLISELSDFLKVDKVDICNFHIRNQHWPILIDKEEGTYIHCKDCGGSTSYYCAACREYIHPHCWSKFHQEKYKKYNK